MSKFLIFSCAIFLIFSSVAFAELKEMANAQEFEQVLAEAQVPVIVQFSAYWCGPCQKLKTTMIEVSQDYTDEQILLYYVDAYVNSTLKKYLDGGYPTTRVFSKGKMGSHFVGSKPSSFVKSFIDGAVSGVSQQLEDNKLIELEDAAAFDEIIKTSEAPVMVQFSAYWCVPCQRLKEKMKMVAPQYSSDAIKICYVDAYKNPELKSYLEGGYPTTKVFRKGKVGDDFFVGDKSEEIVKRFIDNVIKVDISTVNSLIELKDVAEFDRVIGSANVPVVVQFSASWCKPCQMLKETMKKVVPKYSEEKVLVCYVDADKNTELKKYVDGAYPTTKVFFKGQLTKSSFIGDKSEAFVKNFLDNVVKESTEE